ncbi:hypothetical protein EON65_38330 [archaeon]|nr:MAG: hypothetical protein EON65_38330 [archaeon]
MILNILGFNPDIVLLVFYAWLDRYDVSGLDVAYSNHIKRPLFLKLLSSPCGNSNWVFQKSFKDDFLLEWLARRRVAIHQLKLVNIGSESDFASFPHYCNSLRIVKFNNLKQLRDEHIEVLLATCGSIIQSVSIVRCAHITLSSVNAILAKSHKSLKTLHIESIHISAGRIDTTTQTSIQQLCVRDKSTLRGTNLQFLSSIFSICPMLHNLHMGLLLTSGYVHEYSWLDVLSTHCVHMQELTLDYIAMNNILCTLLPTKLPHLLTLNIPTSRKLSSISIADYVNLGQFGHLQKLVTGGQVANTQMLTALCTSAQSSLVHMEVLAAGGVTSEVLHTLAMMCPLLHTLIMHRADVDDEGVGCVLRDCRKLRVLHLPYCTNLTKRSLEHVIKLGYNIEDLDLFIPNNPYQLGDLGNGAFSPADIRALITEGVCKKLVKLNVGDMALNDLFIALMWKSRNTGVL